MTTHAIRSSLLTSTIIAGALFAAMPAIAQSQTAAAAAAEAATGEAIVVTGSRIARANLESVSPVAVIGVEQFRDQGAVNVESVLNQLPQITPGLNANVNNGGNGTATVDVRGLGPSRTLVLVNGRRIVPSNNTGVVDVNTINPQLLERVDVVTGGASSTYGSDALGGVVNFVLKHDFQGIELTAQNGLTERGDSNSFTVGGIIGGNFADGKGNVTMGVSYTDREASFQGSREWSRIDQNGGSGTGIAGRFDAIATNPFGVSPNSSRAFNVDGTTRKFINQLPDDNGGVGDRFNFAPSNYLQTPQKRLTLNALGHYEIATGVEAYAEATYVNSRVDLQLAPTPATSIFVNPKSPVLSEDARTLLAARTANDARAPAGFVVDPATGKFVLPGDSSAVFRRRMVEVGPRLNSFAFDVFQINAGLRGDVFNNWKYDVYYGYGHVGSAQGIQNDVSRQRLTAGLNGCPVGSPTGCVNVNAFGPGNISQAAANYIRIASAVDTFTFDRNNVVGTLTGPLVQLPAGSLDVSVGAEYRKDSSVFIPSDPSQRGDITGFNAAQPIKGSFDAKEVFGEVRIPVLAKTPGAQELTIEAGARYSNYSTVGGNFTWKAGGSYVPIDGLRIRGVYSRATRAPSVFELFQGGDQSFPQVTDPCTQRAPNGGKRPVPSDAVAAICQLQGLPDPRITILTQINAQNEARLLGNTDLKAEKSDTFTVGAVIAPPQVPSLTFTVDYFDIKVDGYIQRVFGGAVGLTDACFKSGVTTLAQYNADPACSLIRRTASGELFQTIPLTNQSTPGINNVIKTRGIDFTAGYNLGLDFTGLTNSKLRFSANVTYLLKYQFNGVDFAGFASGDFGTLPKWKANTRVTFDNGDFSATVNWRYVGKSLDTFGDSPAADPVDFGKIKAQNYFDLSLRFRASENFEFYGGVDNLFDRQPPAVNAGFTATNTDETLYDVLGRRYFVGALIRY